MRILSLLVLNLCLAFARLGDAAEATFPAEGYWNFGSEIAGYGEDTWLLSLQSAKERSSDGIPGFVPDELAAHPEHAWEITVLNVDIKGESFMLVQRLGRAYVTIHEGLIIVHGDPYWEARYRYKIIDGKLELTAEHLKSRVTEAPIPHWMRSLPGEIGKPRLYRPHPPESIKLMMEDYHRRLDFLLR